MISSEDEYILPFQPQATITDDIYKIHFERPHTSLKLWYFNARSLSNKTEEFQHILNEIKSTSGCQIPIIAITEHWIDENTEKHYQFENYSTIITARKNRKGGGSAIFVHHALQYETIYQHDDDENSITSILLKTACEKIVITCIYRPPDTNVAKHHQFLQFLQRHLDTMQNEKVYIIGDFNINVRENNNIVQNYLSTMQMYGLYICDTSTITRPISNTCLDHLHTNEIHKQIILQYVQYDRLDHLMIFVEILDTVPLAIHQTSILSKTINHEKINQYLKSNGLNCKINYDDYIKTVNKLLYDNTQLKQKKKRQNLKKPWIDEHLTKLIKHKNYWFVKYKSDILNDQLKTELHYWRNQVTYWRRKKRKDYFGKRFEDSLNNSKQTWKCVNEVIYNGKKTTHQTTIYDSSDDFTSKIESLNNLNIYFAEIGEKLTSNFKKTVFYETPLNLNTPFKFKKVTTGELSSTIQSLNNTSATGYDNIPTSMIKANSEFLNYTIKELINTSLITGIVPKDLKISKIIPIYKSGNKKDTSNYRPISILPNLDKILSKIINSQLMDYLIKHDLIHIRQYGFRLKSDPPTALFDIVSCIQKHRDNNEIVILVFIDLKKAFDTVKRDILVNKLWHIGVRGTEYNWFKSYLTDRTQYMEIDGVRTNLQTVEEGVPQGGNLASTLFLVFINNLANLDLIATPYLYADDIALVYNGISIDRLQDDIQRDMNLIEKWMDINRLTLNTSKTKYMTITSKNNLKLNISYKNTLIEKVQTFKYLGVHFDNKLSWSTHLNFLIKKLSMIAGLFKKIGKVCPKRTLNSIYYALFNSHLIYGILVWSCASKSKINKIKIIQNRAIRNLFNIKKRESTKQMYKTLNIFPVNAIIKYTQSIHVHNILHSHIHSNSQTLLLKCNHTYNTRRPNHLVLGRNKTTRMGLNSVIYRSIKTYNQLPEEFKDLSKSKFKITVRKHVLNEFCQ